MLSTCPAISNKVVLVQLHISNKMHSLNKFTAVYLLVNKLTCHQCKSNFNKVFLQSSHGGILSVSRVFLLQAQQGDRCFSPASPS